MPFPLSVTLYLFNASYYLLSLVKFLAVYAINFEIDPVMIKILQRGISMSPVTYLFKKCNLIKEIALQVSSWIKILCPDLFLSWIIQLEISKCKCTESSFISIDDEMNSSGDLDENLLLLGHIQRWLMNATQCALELLSVWGT